jgi:hypothetical protein
VIGFRHTDARFPFLWEDDSQPPGRWHGEGEGPVHYFSDTPDGAWAEFLRHEDITEPADVAEVRRAVWAVELGRPPREEPELGIRTLTGGLRSYRACQGEARRLRARGTKGLVAPSAALMPGAAHGWRVEGGLRRGAPRDGKVIALFGPRPDLVGWEAVHEGRPSARLLGRVRHFPGVGAR